MVTRLPRSKEPKYCDYDYDLAHHNIIVQDYTHTLFDDIFPGRYRNLSEIPAQPNAYLINGMGNYEVFTNIVPRLSKYNLYIENLLQKQKS